MNTKDRAFKKSKSILKQILNIYTYEGIYYSPSHSDLIQHLKYDKVDNCEQAKHAHNGYEIDFKETMICLFYDDNSVLIVNCNGGIIAK